MKDVFIIGSGQIPVAKYNLQTPEQLGQQAISSALSQAQLRPSEIGALYVGNMLSGQLSNQQLIATLLANRTGLTGCETLTAEAACGSGAAAARLGYMAIASGCQSAAIVCGVEQMTHASREDTTKGLATASYWAKEGGLGETFISLNAKVMREYMERYNVPTEVFAPFAINAHANGMLSPNAMLHKIVDTEMYLNSKELSAPLKLFDAPPVCDGAAAVILGDEDMALAARGVGLPVAKIVASAVACDRLALSERANLLHLAGAEQSANQAYKQAGITPADIDLFEPHDAYTIMTVLSLEAAGFADIGSGYKMGLEGLIGLGGKLPITTFGGLKSRGHPVGATGVYQLCECFAQLTDTAGDNQVKNADLAMAQNLGGAGSVAYTHILERW